MGLRVEGYNHFGGKHWETAAMKNLLAHAGVKAPHTGKPFSEAMCFGIAGGIGIGYSFCPSIPRYDLQYGEDLAGRSPSIEDNENYYSRLYACGSGMAVVGRHKVYTTGGDYYDGFFQRLGAKTTIMESTGVKGAFKHLTEALSAGRPAVVWCAPMRNFFLGWAGTYGMYSMVVHGIDEDKGEAYVGDRAPDSLTIPLDDLEWLRNKVCSHKNRSLTFTPPKDVTAATLKKAVVDGLKACLGELLKPRMKTFGFPGILEWSKVIDNPKNQKGWPKVYPGGRTYLPLRDVYDSVETAGTGGGLFRPMFADFLDEAMAVTGDRALGTSAMRYRALAKQWRDLAETAMADNVKPFKRTKQLLQKRTNLFEEKGQKAIKQLEGVSKELRDVEVAMRKSFALDEGQTSALLALLKAKIASLHDEELAAAEELSKAIH